MNTIFTKFSVLLLLSFLYSCNKVDDSKMFSLLSSNQTGVKFKNILKETDKFNVLTYSYLYNGGGVSIGDLNNDDLPDLYFTGGMVGSRLYINKGDFKFEEIAQKAGVFAEGLWNTGTSMVDINGDGFLDIYVCRSAALDPDRRRNLLFINNGDLTFTERASEYGIDDSGYSTQGSFFDYDRDGDLDLYVLNHSTQEYAGFSQITNILKNRRNPDYEDRLYKNENGKFINVSDEAGLVSNVMGFGLGIAISDVNNDNWLDIYISNDYNEQDYLYINNQDGTFSENLEEFIGHTSLFSMGSDIADINNDGYTDIMTLDMLPEGNYRIKMVSGPDNYDKYSMLVKNGFYHQSMRNMLHLNNNGKSFSEIGQFSGISNTDWSWAPLFADFDNDGLKDLFVTNGYKRDFTNMDFMNFAVQEKLESDKTGKEMVIENMLKNIPSIVEENYTYKNNGDLTFTKINSEWGFGQKSLSNGAAYADLDNDGDLDLVVNNIDAEPFIYQNNSNKLNNNNFLKIDLKGEGRNTFGIGSKVILTIGNKTLMQEMLPTRGFQSSVNHNLLFGLGESTKVNELKIIWPNAKEQVLKDISPNQTITLMQSDATEVPATKSSPEQMYFEQVPTENLIQYRHRENRYIDFKRELLLPQKQSTQGPKLAKADVNGDGIEDIYLGGAKGSPGQLFIQTKSNTFSPSKAIIFEEDSASEDLGALFFDADNDNDMDLYVVSGGNAYDDSSAELQDRLYLNDGSGNFKKSDASLPSMLTSGSCVKASDYDGDGDLDLFVGGRLVPGRYPTSPRSYILENDGNGNFTDATQKINHDLINIGMVSDAIWTDFNGDHQDDLIIVGEFMGIRVYQNTEGKLNEVSGPNGIEDSSGWWNVIKPGDFDNDGDIDYILGNHGLNSQLKASIAQPITLYAKDFDGNGSIDPILCSYILGENYPVFSKDDLLGQLSILKNRYVNYSDYANQKIEDIFTEAELKGASILEANTFATSYLQNLGDGKFELSPLPNTAQFSPVYGLLVQDFNQDGNQDILLGGNFFGARVKYGRYDANKGLLLLGDGNGDFKTVSFIESGLNVNGEVRDIAIVKMADASNLILFVRNNEKIATYKIK